MLQLMFQICCYLRDFHFFSKLFTSSTISRIASASTFRKIFSPVIRKSVIQEKFKVSKGLLQYCFFLAKNIFFKSNTFVEYSLCQLNNPKPSFCILIYTIIFFLFFSLSLSLSLSIYIYIYICQIQKNFYQVDNCNK